jgi:hypothetical protein
MVRRGGSRLSVPQQPLATLLVEAVWSFASRCVRRRGVAEVELLIGRREGGAVLTRLRRSPVVVEPERLLVWAMDGEG